MLTFRTGAALAALACAALVSGCGEKKDASTAEQTAAPDPAAPTPDPGAATVAPAEVPPPAVEVQAAEPGVWTSGNLRIRADTANLRIVHDRQRRMNLGMTVTIENASNGPVSIAIASDGWPRVQLDNGLDMEPQRGDVSVLRRCEYALDECRQKTSDRFVEIESGRSLSVTMTFEGYFLEGGRDDAKTVDSGTTNMRLFMLDSEGLSRTLDVSLKDVPIQNRIG